MMGLITGYNYTVTLHGTSLNKDGVVKTDLAVLEFSNGESFVAAKNDGIINTRIAMLLAHARGVDIPKNITLLTSITSGKKTQLLDRFNLQAMLLYFAEKKVCTAEESKYLDFCRMNLPDKGFKSFDGLINFLSPVSFFTTQTFKVLGEEFLDLKAICMQYCMQMAFVKLELTDYVPTIEFSASGVTSVFRLSAPFDVTTSPEDGSSFITAEATAPVRLEPSNFKGSKAVTVRNLLVREAAVYNTLLLENKGLLQAVVLMNRQENSLVAKYGVDNFWLIKELVTGGDNAPILEEIIRQHSRLSEKYDTGFNLDTDLAISKLEKAKEANGKGKGKNKNGVLKDLEQQSKIVTFNSKKGKPDLTRQASSSSEASIQTGAKESKDSDDSLEQVASNDSLEEDDLPPPAPAMNRRASTGGNYTGDV
jgi:hypothetical protein